MAHEIETIMFAGQTPWHGLGTYVGEHNVTSQEAIVKAGLDWEVGLMGGFYAHPRTGELVDMSTQAIVRLTDGAKLGEVGSRYQPVQNRDACAFMDGLALDGAMRYHTAMSLKGGSRIAILAQLPGGFTIGKGDRNYPFALLSNPHDGSGKLRVLPTNVRVVCANTERLALRSHDGIAISHDGSIASKLEAAREALGMVAAQHDLFGSLARVLADTPMPQGDMRELAKHLMPVQTDMSDRVKQRVQDDRELLVDLQRHGKGNDLPGVAGSAWAALNAVTEYVGNYRGSRSSQEARLESAWFGQGNAMTQQAVSWMSSAYSLGMDDAADSRAQQHLSIV